MKTKIKGPILTARSFFEYVKMFNLDLDLLKNKNILDCAAGASSFTALMTSKGYKVKALDLLYDKEYQFLKEMCEYHLDVLIKSLSSLKNHFIWDYFKDLDELKKHRLEAQNQFLEDYKIYKGEKYIKANLTDIPFFENKFSLILCSHLLFIYDHRLSYEFHLNSIKEMMRVAEEVRIYPLIKHRAMKSEFIRKIKDDLMDRAEVKIENVDYEFRKGGNQMMNIKKI